MDPMNIFELSDKTQVLLSSEPHYSTHIYNEIPQMKLSNFGFMKYCYSNMYKSALKKPSVQITILISLLKCPTPRFYCMLTCSMHINTEISSVFDFPIYLYIQRNICVLQQFIFFLIHLLYIHLSECMCSINGFCSNKKLILFTSF